jgi:hypothetical protein
MTTTAEAVHDCQCCKHGRFFKLADSEQSPDPLCGSCLHLKSDHEESLISFPKWDDGEGGYW